MYGAKAFIQQPPLFPSQLDDIRGRKKPDLKALERDVETYVKAKEEGRGADGQMYSHVRVPVQPRGMHHHQPGPGPVPPPGSGQGAPVVQVKQRPPEEEGLPPGWATAKDPNGKVYYWHRETKQVQWHRPDAAAEPQEAKG